jgi:hypothetical protein
MVRLKSQDLPSLLQPSERQRLDNLRKGDITIHAAVAATQTIQIGTMHKEETTHA